MKAGRRTWTDKFRNAFRGIHRAARTQSSFRVHLVTAAVVVASGLALHLSADEWCLFILAIGLVLMAELMNTAIESLARGPGRRPHPRIRDALDIASAGVLLAALAALLIGIITAAKRLL